MIASMKSHWSSCWILNLYPYVCQIMMIKNYLTTRFSMFSWRLSTAITSHRLQYFLWCYFIWQVYLKVWGQKLPAWFKSKHNCSSSYFLFPYPYFIKSHYFGRFWHHSSNKGGKEDCHILICSLFIWVLIILLNYFYHIKRFMLGIGYHFMLHASLSKSSGSSSSTPGMHGSWK